MSEAPVIVWFRQDLRLSDNPALMAAVSTGKPVIPLFIMDEETKGVRPLGGATKWWLHHALEDLDGGLADLGLKLTLRRGAAAEIIDDFVTAAGAAAVYWNRCYEPGVVERDSLIKTALKQKDVTVESFNGSLLYEPWDIRTKQGRPYGVFTPFYKMMLSYGAPPPPVASPGAASQWTGGLSGDSLESWGLLPTKPDWADGLRESWQPTEGRAMELLDTFLAGPVNTYMAERDYPGLSATSRLSPYLHFGQISPRQIWARTAAREPSSGTETFLKELVWREFGYHLLYHRPEMPSAPLQQKFERFPWAQNDEYLKAWQKGQTGYPIVDAGMRELWQTGTMHNRVRMIVASFLVKHLLIDWCEGERWFWGTLVDADLASNTANWQWVAGCGADAAPYFRIFNPITQGEKFDAAGTYVRRWIPEIAELPDDVIHTPWMAGPDTLASKNIILGNTYPFPIVDHKEARARALAALETLKSASRQPASETLAPSMDLDSSM